MIGSFGTNSPDLSYNVNEVVLLALDLKNPVALLYFPLIKVLVKGYRQNFPAQFVEPVINSAVTKKSHLWKSHQLPLQNLSEFGPFLKKSRSGLVGRADF